MRHRILSLLDVVNLSCNIGAVIICFNITHKGCPEKESILTFLRYRPILFFVSLDRMPNKSGYVDGRQRDDPTISHVFQNKFEFRELARCLRELSSPR